MICLVFGLIGVVVAQFIIIIKMRMHYDVLYDVASCIARGKGV